MTAREFLKLFFPDERLVTGAFFSDQPLQVEPGDTVGIVLLGAGGPRSLKEVKPFLYNKYMDPVTTDMPVSGVFRHWLSQWLSTLRSRKTVSEYETLGGGSAENRLFEEQAEALESLMNERYSMLSGVTFKTYLAMRYWHPTSEAAALAMQADGVNKVILLPLSPQYSKMTTGSSLAYWWQLGQTREMPAWPTRSVKEYAIHPKYIQSIHDRINEGLQRFSKKVRPDVHLAFSAPGTPLHVLKEERDPYCCLIHSTVDYVMSSRTDQRSFSISFHGKAFGPAMHLTPDTTEKLHELAEQPGRNVLVVPLSFVTDHHSTAYELDIAMREEARVAGIERFEVTAGLNNHPLLMEAFSDAVISALEFPHPIDPYSSGDGAPVVYNDLENSTNEAPCSLCGVKAGVKVWTGGTYRVFVDKKEG